MRTGFLAALLAVSSNSPFAAECGRDASTQRLTEHVRALLIVEQRISAHIDSMTEEAGKKLATARSHAELSDIQAMNFQAAVLATLKSTAVLAQEVLFAARTVVDIRDQMLDRRDVQRVTEFVSLYLVRLKTQAKNSEALANMGLRQFTAPGITIDIAALRDQMGKIADEYRSCELPERKRP